MTMKLNEYHEQARTTDMYPAKDIKHLVKKGIFLDETHLLEYTFVCLDGEMGEIGNKIKKIRRDYDSNITKEMCASIMYELGDVLWYICRMGDIIGFDLDDIARLNLRKLQERKKNNIIRGNGDNRTVTKRYKSYEGK